MKWWQIGTDHILTIKKCNLSKTVMVSAEYQTNKYSGDTCMFFPLKLETNCFVHSLSNSYI